MFCLINRFALTEAKSAIAHLVHNFRLEPCEKTDIPVKYNTKTEILKPANGMYLRFAARN